MKPNILISATRTQDELGSKAVLNYTYIDSVAKHALPVIAPNIAPGSAGEYASMFDGLLLTGGGDMDPKFFGEPKHAQTEIVHPDYDAGDMALFAAFVAAKKPVFGICRGVQVINVCMGGSLIQHLPDVTNTVTHSVPDDYTTHTVTPVEGGFIHKLLPERELVVNSRHHQAIGALAAGLIPAAHAKDGIIEAVQAKDQLVFGVQWHPERHVHPLSDALFDWFAGVCKGH